MMGGAVLHPIHLFGIWEGRERQRRTDIRVNVDLASLPGPPGFLGGPWMQVHGGGFAGADVAACLTVLASSAKLLLSLEPCVGRWVLRTWAHFGVSFLELLFVFEQWAGHPLLSEKVTRPHVRTDRPFLIPVSEGIEIRHGCQFISSLVV